MSDWTTARVVRDRDGDLWGRTALGWILLPAAWGSHGHEDSAAELLADFGPLVPVLDADGLPVVRTVGDLTALDALPVGSVVMEGTTGAPVSAGPFGIPVMPGVFHRFPYGWYVVSGRSSHLPEFDLGPLTILHIPPSNTPCEVLP